MAGQSHKTYDAGKLTESQHIHPVFVSSVPPRVPYSLDVLYQRLTALVFPWHILDYPGRTAALALALGYAPTSIETAKKRGRMSAPMALRAEKFCTDMIRELEALRREFADQAETLRIKQAPKRRGMLEVRVRDETGIPRNAVYNQGHKPKPPPF